MADEKASLENLGWNSEKIAVAATLPGESGGDSWFVPALTNTELIGPARAGVGLTSRWADSSVKTPASNSILRFMGLTSG